MQARPDIYSVPSGYSLNAGRGPSVLYVPPGSIATISTNTRASVDPKNDPTANPNYPAAPPWETGSAWSLSDALGAFCGAVFADGIGEQGTLMMWAAPGHSTNLEATCWVGFDVATREWKIVGRKPLPCAPFTASPGNFPPSTQFDHEWGDWIGGSTDWPEAFRQPGYNPPFGSHTRNSFVYIPPAAAGNTKGKIVIAWQPTGNGSGTDLRGSWVWDADTELFSRTANLRPQADSTCTGMAFAPDANIVIGQNAFSSTVSLLDFLDLSTMTWTRRNATSSVVVSFDSTNFVIGDLFVMARNGDGSPPTQFLAAPISTVKAGGSWAWTTLTVSAASWPTKSGATWNVSWARCPINGAYYAVNQVNGSNKLWMLTPPTTDGDTAGLLSGTWTITEETLTGSLAGASFDYSRLRWCHALTAFLWFSDSPAGVVQAIRPNGV